ncbi:RNA-binding S4 domain-containing protein [Streptomyces sp. JNUCC 64]
MASDLADGPAPTPLRDALPDHGTNGSSGSDGSRDAGGGSGGSGYEGPEETSAGRPAGNSATTAAGPVVAPDPAQGSARVDSWIWSVRLVKSRSLAAAACRGGHVRVNGERVKPAYGVRVGDEVRVRQEGRDRVVIVKRIIRKRVGAPVAVDCYVDNSPPPPPRDAVAPAGIRDRGTGRPTKRDRREMERLRSTGGLGITRGPDEPTGFAATGEDGRTPGPGRGRGPGSRDGRPGRSEPGGRGERDGRGERADRPDRDRRH